MYKIVRMYFEDNTPSRVIKRNLTLAEARAHCRDPETSSRTCTTAQARKETELYGPWFDGYKEQ